MPQAIHESLSFNSCKRKVAIHCVFSAWDNTHFVGDFCYVVKTLQNMSICDIMIKLC